MKDLILHLGLQKTGSTSIQETLLYNPEVLARAGYEYAKIDWPDLQRNSNHSFPFIVAFSDGWQDNGEIVRRGWTAEGLKPHFQAAIARALDRPANLIFSGEDITDIGAAGLAAFAALAASQGFSIRPFMLVRSPLEFITSMTQTRIRHGHGQHVFAGAKSRRIEPCLRLWPDLTCLPFAEAARHADGPIGLFLDQFGLPPAGAFNLIRQNESLSDHATRLIGHVNAVIPLFRAGGVNPARTYLDTEPLARIPGPKFALTRSEFLEVRSLVQSENESLSRLLGPEFCDTTLRFNPQPAPWSEAAIQALAEAMAPLGADLQAAIRSFFAEGDRVGPEERRLAAAILG